MAELRLSLLARAVLTHVGVAVLPVAVLGGLTYRANEAALEATHQDLNLAVVTQLRRDTELAVRTRADALGVAAAILTAPETSLASRSRLLRSVVAQSGLPFIAVRTPEGAVDTLAWVGASRPTPLAELPSFDLERAAARGFSLSGGAGHWEVLIPLENDGVTLGFLSTAFPAAALSESQHLYRERFLGDRGRVVMASGTPPVSMIDRSPEPLLRDFAEAPEGSRFELDIGAASTFEGPKEVWFRAVVSSPDLGCWFASAQPRRVALASLGRLRTQLSITALFAALLASLVGMLSALRLTRPIERLALEVRASVKGGLRARLPEEGAPELIQLSRGFNRAVRLLSKRRQELLVETRMRTRLSRHLSARELEDVFSRDLDLESLGLGPEDPITVLLVDVRAPNEGSLAETAPDRLVLILGEVFRAVSEAIEGQGGALHPRAGDTVIGVFALGSASASARAALQGAEAVLQEGQQVLERWTESAAGPTLSAGLVSDPGARDLPELIEKASVLQRSAPPFSALADETTIQAATRKDLLPTRQTVLDQTVYELKAPSLEPPR